MERKKSKDAKIVTYFNLKDISLLLSGLELMMSEESGYESGDEELLRSLILSLNRLTNELKYE